MKKKKHQNIKNDLENIYTAENIIHILVMCHIATNVRSYFTSYKIFEEQVAELGWEEDEWDGAWFIYYKPELEGVEIDTLFTEITDKNNPKDDPNADILDALIIPERKKRGYIK